jgi:chorismate mutase-like protein
MSKSLEQLRQEIDRLDDQIVRLLNQRSSLAVEIGEIKQSSGAPLYVPSRERVVLNRLMTQNSGPLSHRSIARIYAEVMSSAIALEHHSSIVAGGAPEKELIDAALFLAGGNADVKCIAGAGDLADAFAAEKKSFLVVADAWCDAVIRELKARSTSGVWRGCWQTGISGSRFHLFTHDDSESDLSRPAVLFCLIENGEPEISMPPSWLSEIPASSFEFYPLLSNSRQGILKIKMELNVRDAREQWLEKLVKHSAAVWII